MPHIFAERYLWNIHQSGLAPENFTTLEHFSVSAAMSLSSDTRNCPLDYMKNCPPMLPQCECDRGARAISGDEASSSLVSAPFHSAVASERLAGDFEQNGLRATKASP